LLLVVEVGHFEGVLKLSLFRDKNAKRKNGGGEVHY
jgi:hypothetical protein